MFFLGPIYLLFSVFPFSAKVSDCNVFQIGFCTGLLIYLNNEVVHIIPIMSKRPEYLVPKNATTKMKLTNNTCNRTINHLTNVIISTKIGP